MLVDIDRIATFSRTHTNLEKPYIFSCALNHEQFTFIKSI